MSIDKKNIGFKEICDIIRLCRKQGITSFKWEGVELSFGEVQAAAKQAVKKTNDIMYNEGPSVDIKDELELREMQLAELHITDPLLYEEMMTRGELAG